MSNILVTVPVYNAEKYIKKCIASLKKQSYRDFQCIIIDDASTDNTFQEASEVIDDRFTLIKNNENRGALANIVSMIEMDDIDDETIICNLDGDDWLASPDALQTVVDKYEETDCLLTHGTYIHSNKTLAPPHHRQPIPPHIKAQRSYRGSTFYTSHMRTYKKKLWDQIDKEDMKNDYGEYYKAGWDLAFMFPMCEMAGDRVEFIDKIIYCYNVGNPLNDHKVHRKEQLDAEKEIRQKEKYECLEGQL